MTGCDLRAWPRENQAEGDNAQITYLAHTWRKYLVSWIDKFVKITGNFVLKTELKT